ncbi:MAG: hypothetical protein IH624_14370 [Phycisphaerae bacterium]|nr:hypothetical protein [Phycisphaerae bacterium]
MNEEEYPVLKKTQQKHRFDEFDQHVSLWNVVPAGKGHSLVVLRKIADGIHNGTFKKSPSVLIAGEGARTLGMALANTLCSEDVRQCDAKYLNNTRSQIEHFAESLFDTVHIISNVNTIGMGEGVLWHFLRNGNYKFQSFDGAYCQYVYVHGILCLCCNDMKSVSPSLLAIVDHKITVEPYTHQQLELMVHQRLAFCGVDYEDDEGVLVTIVKHGDAQMNQIIDVLRMCVLLVQAEGRSVLDVSVVERAVRLL